MQRWTFPVGLMTVCVAASRFGITRPRAGFGCHSTCPFFCARMFRPENGRKMMAYSRRITICLFFVRFS